MTSRRTATAAGLLACVVVVSACSASGTTAATPTTTATTTSTTATSSAPTTSAAPSSEGGDLRDDETTLDEPTGDETREDRPGPHHVEPTPESDALGQMLIPSIDGFTLQPHDVGDTGPSDLDKAADDDGRPDAEERLTREGFVVGYQSFFTSPDGVYVVLFLYEFDSRVGAWSEFDYFAREMTRGNYGAVALTVPGVPGAFGVENQDDANHFEWVQFAHGPYWVLVQAQGPLEVDLPSAADLAAEQYQRLPPAG